MVKKRCPFLISVPHGGTEVPEIIRPLLLLDEDELRYYCDPNTRVVFDFKDRVVAYIDTPVSRMIVDLNRPPLPLPLRDPDGIIKVRTIDGREVYRPGQVPDMLLIHSLLRTYYFPFHQHIDELIDRQPVRVAFDCHSMLPFGSRLQKDAGKVRPLVCLGNNGDRQEGQEKAALLHVLQSGLPFLRIFSGRSFPLAAKWQSTIPFPVALFQMHITGTRVSPGSRLK